jgi:putative MATE family efflux protein
MLRNRIFWNSVLRIAIPIIIQNFISAFLNMVDVIMVGQLGDTAVAGVGLANQVPFLLIFMLFGISSGSATLTAQLWGKGDIPNIRKVLILCLAICGLGGVFFTGVGLLAPTQALTLYSSDPAVIALGGRYLRLSAISYLMTAVSWSYASVLKSTGVVKPQMFVSMLALGLKTLLNYCLIFGNLGLPRMDTDGAAIATVVSRLVEMSAILLIVYGKRSEIAVYPKHLAGLTRGIVALYMKTALPVMFNELFWAMGITAYNIIYAHISTQAIAAYNIVGSVESVAFVIFIGLSDACGVLVGNKIGAGKEDEAYNYARWLWGIVIIFALLVGVGIFFSRNAILSLYNVEEITRGYASDILLVSACVLWVRTSLMTVVVGIFRAGGDTRFSLIVDAGSIWLVGVPMAALGAFIFNVPVPIVYVMATGEEFIKFGICIYRFFSKKWIHNLAHHVEAATAESVVPSA